MASGLNIAAFNIGIAIGAVLGGAVIEHRQLMDTPWIGALIVLLALVLTRLSGLLDRRDADRTALAAGESRVCPRVG